MAIGYNMDTVYNIQVATGYNMATGCNMATGYNIPVDTSYNMATGYTNSALCYGI